MPQSGLLLEPRIDGSMVLSTARSTEEDLTNVPIKIEDMNTKILSTYEHRHLEFYPLQTGDLSNVHFQLTQTDDKFPPLSNKNAKLFITLLFRKKK